MNTQKIYCYPDSSEENKYIFLQEKIWSNLGFDVVSWRKLFMLKNLTLRCSNTIILNWFEDRLGYTKRNAVIEFFICLLLLLFFSFYCKKVVWVRHNYKPHNIQHKKINFFMYKLLVNLLYRLSDKVISHAPVHDRFKTTVIPHPLYNQDFSVLNKIKRDVDYLYFGTIKEYKSLDKLLLKWPVDKKLTLLGKSESDDLTNKILSIIRDRNLDVIWMNQFLSIDELEDNILKAKFVIIPHMDDSMIVSGAFFHAISFGANVWLANNKFSKNLANKHEFVKVFNSSEEINSEQKINDYDVLSDAMLSYGDEVLYKSWHEILS